MKRILLTLGIVVLAAGATMAQGKKGKGAVADPTVAAAQDAKPASTLKAEDMAFTEAVHDFGTIQEGPNADHEFVFVNKGKEPIILQNVQASCGCTTPTWTKDPILPGKKGIVKASYSTVNRPGPFTKSITVTSNAGVTVLSIKGEVEKAPASSVPENTSMIKTN